MNSTHTVRAVRASVWLAGGFVGFGLADEVGAQRTPFPTQVVAQPSPDSAHVLDQAKDAQRRFERIRVRHLPWQWGSGSGPCDEIVGRMCWRHDDPEDNWVKPDDPEPLVEARDDLIESLALHGQRLPGDRWILAQRVWYLGEADRWDEAVAITSDCPGQDRLWCAALRGFALHESGHFVEAAAAFVESGSVIDEIAGDERDALRALFDNEGRDLLDAAADGPPPTIGLAPDSLMWLLADPMYLVPGNDRRTEHSARRVVNRIRDGARNPYSMSWGDDMSELVVRYGWAIAWEKVRGSGLTNEPLAIVGRHLSKGRGFIPKGSVVSAPAGATAAELAPVDRRPRTTYRPRYASVVRQAQAEVFAFDRGDSLLFIGAFLPPDTSNRPQGVVQEGAFAANLTSGDVVAGHRVAPGRWTLRAANAPTVVSLERMPPLTAERDSLGTAWRYRRAFDSEVVSPEVVRLSDLLFLDEGHQPETPEDAVLGLRSAQVRPGQTITVAWEVYGVGFDEAQMEYEVLVGKKRGGLLSRVGGWVGLGGGDEGLSIDWSEPQPDDPGPHLRHVSVTFPELEEGTYTVRLALRMAGRSEVVRERELEVFASR